MKLLILLFLLAGSSANAKTNTLVNIKWTSYPGARIKGHCAQYASTLAFDLQMRKIESYYVEYEWKNGSKHGAHALVIIHADDKWVMVDNEVPSPWRINGKLGKEGPNFSAMVKQRYSYVTKVRE